MKGVCAIAHNELDGLSSHQTCFSCVCHSHDIENEPHEKSWKIILEKANAGSAFLGTPFIQSYLFVAYFLYMKIHPQRKFNDPSCSF